MLDSWKSFWTNKRLTFILEFINNSTAFAVSTNVAVSQFFTLWLVAIQQLLLRCLSVLHSVATAFALTLLSPNAYLLMLHSVSALFYVLLSLSATLGGCSGCCDVVIISGLSFNATLGGYSGCCNILSMLHSILSLSTFVTPLLGLVLYAFSLLIQTFLLPSLHIPSGPSSCLDEVVHFPHLYLLLKFDSTERCSS